MGFFRTWARALYEVVVDPSTRNLVITVLLLLSGGTVFYHFVEGWKLLDALYFSVITLTTVGYGDFAPKTDLGKLFTIVYLLSGISLIIAFANTVLRRAVALGARRQAGGMDATERLGEPGFDDPDQPDPIH